MRRILLPLAADTTDTHCGSCTCVDAVDDCAAFDVLRSGDERVPECIAAERAAANIHDTLPPIAAHLDEIDRPTRNLSDEDDGA